MDIVAFLIQFWDNAGPGAWGILTTWVGAFFVLILAFKNGEKDITKSDVFAFSIALLCIVFYISFDNPIYSLILVLTISLLAMYPTFRKSYYKPHQETLSIYVIAGIRSAISIIATVHISVLTISLPVLIILTNTVFITMCLVRKKQLHSNTC